MKKIALVFSFMMLFGFNAFASVDCYTDSLGNTRCSGTDSNGNYVSTNSYTDSLGNTTTTGHIGDDYINTNSYTDSLGNTNYDFY